MSYRQTMPVEQRFWTRVDRSHSSGCWLWQGKPDKKGYGRFCYNRRIVFAHRFSYELAYGSIPEGLYVCHTCDVPACVNPSHFFLGTLADNNADMRAKGRSVNPPAKANKTSFQKGVTCGEKHPRAKLTWDDIAEARQLRQQGWLWRELASRYGVTMPSIRKAVHGYTWKVQA